jgi:hypothetical protein
MRSIGCPQSFNLNDYDKVDLLGSVYQTNLIAIMTRLLGQPHLLE